MVTVSAAAAELGSGDFDPEASESPVAAPSALQRLILDRMHDQSWSYGTVARRGNMSRSTLHHIATTASLLRPPRPDTLEALALGLDLPLAAVRGAAAESAGLHVNEVAVGSETAVLIASLEELTADDRRHVAALIDSLRRSRPPTSG